MRQTAAGPRELWFLCHLVDSGVYYHFFVVLDADCPEFSVLRMSRQFRFAELLTEGIEGCLESPLVSAAIEFSYGMHYDQANKQMLIPWSTNDASPCMWIAPIADLRMRVFEEHTSGTKPV